MDQSELAVKLLIRCCPGTGAFSTVDAPEIWAFLRRLVSDIDSAKDSELFGVRYREHVAHAIRIVVESPTMSSPAAIATSYLLTRFEYYFRVLSQQLDREGSWLDINARDAILANLVDQKLAKRLKKPRISRLEDTYKLLVLTSSHRAAGVFSSVDQIIFKQPSVATGNRDLTDIGDRIAFSRNNSAHGEGGDVSAEGIFSALATAIVFYNQ